MEITLNAFTVSMQTFRGKNNRIVETRLPNNGVRF